MKISFICLRNHYITNLDSGSIDIHLGTGTIRLWCPTCRQWQSLRLHKELSLMDDSMSHSFLLEAADLANKRVSNTPPASPSDTPAGETIEAQTDENPAPASGPRQSRNKGSSG